MNTRIILFIVSCHGYYRSRCQSPTSHSRRDLAGIQKGLPYQTYIKSLLHEALEHERALAERK